MSMRAPEAAHIVTLEQLVEQLAGARDAGHSVALANGAFDVLHVGHVRYLRAAADTADILVVAVNSDASVRGLKGAGRPLIPEQERAEVVASVRGVDWVVIFEQPTVETVIRAICPDVQVKGTDYTPDTVPEAALVRSLGGQVRIVGDPKDHSSTALLSRMGGS